MADRVEGGDRCPAEQQLAVQRGTVERPQAQAVSFTDGLNNQTTYHYHVQLTGLEPGTRYYYRISDGAAPKLVKDFVAAWTKVMNLDRFDTRA